MTKYVLAIDQGTTSSRAVVFDERGEVRGLAQHPTQQLFPHPGWVNQNADDLWETTLSSIKEAIESAGIGAGAVAAIGIANQRETTVLWDRTTGEPVAPAIVWQSRQSAPLVDEIGRRGKSAIYQRVTGLVPDAYFSATKIAWMLDRDLELRKRAEAGDVLFGTVDSWLVWNLSGRAVHTTDISNASRTMLFDIRSLDWSEALLDDLAIPRSMLPKVTGNSQWLCDANSDLFGSQIPVMGSAGDQQSALFGQACFAPGQGKNTYGTGSFLLMNTGAEAVKSTHRLLTTVAWQLSSATEYALEGAIFVTGSAIQWLRDGLGIISAADDVEGVAGRVDDSGGVVFVPALVGLGAPHWDANARGTIIGITRGTTQAHLARATLEAICYQTRDVVDAMEADSGVRLSELRVDGGASKNNLLMQIQADVLGVPVVRPKVTETTALGAAYLAGLAAGVWESRDSLIDHWQIDRRFEPRMSETDRESGYARWQEAVDRSKGWERTHNED